MDYYYLIITKQKNVEISISANTLTMGFSRGYCPTLQKTERKIALHSLPPFIINQINCKHATNKLKRKKIKKVGSFS